VCASCRYFTKYEPPGEWLNDAACRNKDPEIFFSELGGHFTDAVRICATCPVTSQCLNHAIDNGEKYGVFGGLTPAQRLNLTRANAS
jgi:WhiB family redox-sensing transcriptional regulator